MEYGFDIVYRATVKYHSTGAVSRFPTKGGDDSDVNDKIPIMVVAMRLEKRVTKSKTTLQHRLTFIQTNHSYKP